MIADSAVKKVELVEYDEPVIEKGDIESQTISTRPSVCQSDSVQGETPSVQMNPKQIENVNGNGASNNNNYQQFVDCVIENYPQQNINEENSQQTDELLQQNPLMEMARRNFMKKVFSIIFFQLLLTSLLCAASMYIREFLNFQLDQYGFLFLALGMVIFTQIYVCASRTAARRVPLNYILLLAFTLGWAYLISFFCSGFSVNPDGTPNERGQTIIFLSVIVTFSIVFALSFFAWATTIDFTIGGTSCSILGSALAIISTLILIGFPFIYIAYSLLSGVTFGFYLVFDLQTIMDGKYTDITLDDYILASMLVYTDIVMLFIRTVEIISRILPRD